MKNARKLTIIVLASALLVGCVEDGRGVAGESAVTPGSEGDARVELELDATRSHLLLDGAAKADDLTVRLSYLRGDESSGPRIAEIRLAHSANVKMTGHAMTHKELNAFRVALENTNYFRRVGVESRPPFRFPYSRQVVYRYTLNCYFPKREKAGGE